VFDRHQQFGVTWTDHDGWRVPEAFSGADAEAACVRASAGLADLSWMLKFDVKGRGLRRPLAIGGGACSWVLGPLHALVTCEPPAREEVLKRLEAPEPKGPDASPPPPMYVTDVTSVFAQFLLAGPRSRQVMSKLSSINVSERSLPNLSCGQTGVAHVGAIVLRKDVGGIAAFHILVSREYAESVWDAIMHAGHEFHLSPFGLRAQRQLNV